MNLSIGSESKQGYRFELVVQVRDNQGTPLNKAKSFTTDSAEELELLWIRNNGAPRKKKRKKTDAATKNQVGEAIIEATTYTEKIRKKRRLED